MNEAILIVDTDPTTESLVYQSLNDPSCEIEMVSDTAAAMHHIETQGASLVIVNADLPKGWRFCTELKKKDDYTELPVVLVSGTATEEIFLEHQRLPTRADAYFSKPLELESLRMAFLALLAGERPQIFEVDLATDGIDDADEPSGPSSLDVLDAPTLSMDSPPEEVPPAPDVPVQAAEPVVAQPQRKVRRRAAQPEEPEAALPEELELNPEEDMTQEDADLTEVLLEQVDHLEAELAQEKKRVALLTRKLKASIIKQRSGDATAPTQAVAMQKKISDLTSTATVLREKHMQQSEELSGVLRKLEAAEAEVEATRSALDQRNRELERLAQAQQSTGADDSRIEALEAYVIAVRDAHVAFVEQAKANELGLREVIAEYQHREESSNSVRIRESGLTDAVLQVLDHVYQNLDLLRKDISEGVPDVPEAAPIEPFSGAIPAPLEAPELPVFGQMSESVEAAEAPDTEETAEAFFEEDSLPHGAELTPEELEALVAADLTPEELEALGEEDVSADELASIVGESLDGAAGGVDGPPVDDLPLTEEELASLTEEGSSPGAAILDDEFAKELSSLGIEVDRNPGGELPYASGD